MISLRTQDVHILQPGVPIEAQIGQVLPKKSKAFAEEKDRDQRKHHNRDERVAAEKGLNCGVSAYAASFGNLFSAKDRWGWSESFHINDDAKRGDRQQCI